MAPPITAAMLYDLVRCPHRPTMDLLHDEADRDPVSAFVRLLWERGSLYEKEVIEALREPFLDLSPLTGRDQERATLDAMARGETLIYGGRITHEDLLGEPDLLRREAQGYVAGDIKSGAGETADGGGGGTPKKHYAMQLALYTDILERLGQSAGRRAFVWDGHGDEVPYDLTLIRGKRNPRTFWAEYEAALERARSIVARTIETTPAYTGACRQCVWHSRCLQHLQDTDDLTLIAGLGRSERDAMRGRIDTVAELAASDAAAPRDGKQTVFPGIGAERLERFIARARQMATGGAPYLTAPLDLPTSRREIFFDIEVDSMRDRCYLHGFLERRDGSEASERFISFLAETGDDASERQAFADAWAFLQQGEPFVAYVYSTYERTWYRKLQARYPDVCSDAAVEALFDPARVVDLYAVARNRTVWPTRNDSLKTLASHLGFRWRDAHPSGAESIEWFHRWSETRSPELRQRILEYNEDDCRATRVLLDGMRSLPEGPVEV